LKEERSDFSGAVPSDQEMRCTSAVTSKVRDSFNLDSASGGGTSRGSNKSAEERKGEAVPLPKIHVFSRSKNIAPVTKENQEENQQGLATWKIGSIGVFKQGGQRNSDLKGSQSSIADVDAQQEPEKGRRGVSTVRHLGREPRKLAMQEFRRAAARH